MGDVDGADSRNPVFLVSTNEVLREAPKCAVPDKTGVPI
jgi:hypothetical protein